MEKKKDYVAWERSCVFVKMWIFLQLIYDKYDNESNI